MLSRIDAIGEIGHDLAIDGHATGEDVLLALPPGADTSGGQDFVKSFARFARAIFRLRGSHSALFSQTFPGRQPWPQNWPEIVPSVIQIRLIWISTTLATVYGAPSSDWISDSK